MGRGRHSIPGRDRGWIPRRASRPSPRPPRTTLGRIACLAAILLGLVLLLSLQDTNTGRRHAEYIERRRAAIAAFDWQRYLQGAAVGSDHRARGYWMQTARTRYDFHDDPNGRGLPVVNRDPLGSDTTIQYDDHGLLPVEVTDAAGLTTRAEYDYRVMQPRLATDPHSNRVEYAFTSLGLLRETYLRGKAGRNEGDRDQPSIRFEYVHNWLSTPARFPVSSPARMRLR